MHYRRALRVYGCIIRMIRKLDCAYGLNVGIGAKDSALSPCGDWGMMSSTLYILLLHAVSDSAWNKNES